MGLNKQLRDVLEQLIDDTIMQSAEFVNVARSFRPLVDNDVDFALGIAVGEIIGGFYNYFTVMNRRAMSQEELLEMYYIIRGRAEEIKNAIVGV
ncbi:MAG: hypothetical protein ACK4FV_03705 [Candidatus Nitrosocaldus sp.]